MAPIPVEKRLQQLPVARRLLISIQSMTTWTTTVPDLVCWKLLKSLILLWWWKWMSFNSWIWQNVTTRSHDRNKTVASTGIISYIYIWLAADYTTPHNHISLVSTKYRLNLWVYWETRSLALIFTWCHFHYRNKVKYIYLPKTITKLSLYFPLWTGRHNFTTVIFIMTGLRTIFYR